MELSSCCCLLSFLHTGCKRCLHFSNADSDKLINISWKSINKIQTAHAVLQMLQSNIKPYYFLLPLLYEIKISFFIFHMADSHPQNSKDKLDAPNIKKYLMGSVFIVKEKIIPKPAPKTPWDKQNLPFTFANCQSAASDGRKVLKYQISSLNLVSAAY